MNVYKMNDCDWMAANSKEEAMQSYAEMLGDMNVEEAIKDGMIEPDSVYEENLDSEMFVDLSEPELGKTTFRAVIEERAARGDHAPFFIASTEY